MREGGIRLCICGFDGGCAILMDGSFGRASRIYVPEVLVEPELRRPGAVWPCWNGQSFATGTRYPFCELL